MSNRFWDSTSSRVSSQTINTEYETPAALWAAAVEYFTFVDNNPIEVQVSSFSQGTFVTGELEKPRVFSLAALCRFIGISRNQWKKIKEGKLDFTPVCEKIEDVIYTQIYELGMAEAINSNMASRAIGMGDKTQITGAGPNGEHLSVSGFRVDNLSLEQLQVLEQAILEAVTPSDGVKNE